MRSTDFHSLIAFATAKTGFENWTLSLPSALPVRVAPVESLHLPRKVRGLAQDCLICISDLGFPEFESGHLIDFSNKAQLC
ncbi:hypothetical protein [cyanobacterium endosymbiont of Rhopalodia gibberula]|uniref:hypothetical protein n=1 Tax=cyanobacterium endosymbiont of Rhopalodia gibberula TaxID=1763363 RepID=UPI000E64CA3A|nr:hypothetical protein [cyanobacterium endosymbiont of Rhopalodia gibberula]